jgi:hypothetical protein
MFRSARPRVTPAAATTAPKIPKVTMLLAVPPLVAEKKSEQQGDRTKLPGGRTRDRQLAENGLQLARVLKDGDDEPEGRGGQGDGEKERIADPPHRMEGGACDGPEQQRAGKPGERSAELTGGRRPEVDLQPGQEEQKGQAKQRHHIDRLIDLQPSQDGRPDDNPGDDLHDGAWQLHAPHGRGQDGRSDRDRADNQQPIEAHCAHGPHAVRSDSTVRYLLLSPHARHPTGHGG